MTGALAADGERVVALVEQIARQELVQLRVARALRMEQRQGIMQCGGILFLATERREVANAVALRLAAGLVISTAQDGGHQLHRVEAHHAMPKANRRRLVTARELCAVCLEKTY